MRSLLGYLSGDKTTEVLNMTNNQLTPRTLDMVIAFANRNNILKTLYLMKPLAKSLMTWSTVLFPVTEP